MVFAVDVPIVRRAEALALRGEVNATLAELRHLSALDFGMLHLGMPNPEYPGLSAVLPHMAPENAQVSWTGSHGYDLFRATKDFVLRLQFLFETQCRRPLSGSRILDFGCGWGRILRMMAYYTDPENLYGLDPADSSLALCRQAGVLGHLLKSDVLPDTLPVGTVRFDLIYAYSVFTHTSMHATTRALAALRRSIKPDGLLVITIRSIEIWTFGEVDEERALQRAALVAEYERTGFAFDPQPAFEVGGELTYGDTSIAPDWIRMHVPDWTICATDRGEDHTQYIIALRPS